MEGREGIVLSSSRCEGGGSGKGGGGGWGVPHAAPSSSGVAPPEGTDFTTGVVGSGDGVEVGDGDLVVVKKRGRPRKYVPDGLALVPSPTAGSASPFSPGSGSSEAKRGRGRPRGSGNRQLLAALGEFFTFSAGGGFTPHVLTIATGEDVVARIRSFSGKGPRATFILSANGAVSNATLHQQGSSGGTLTYEGRFEILSLSGSFSNAAAGGARSRTGSIYVSLAGPDGHVIGGGVAGSLLAASPIQMIVGSFKPNAFQNQQAKPSQSTATRPTSPANPDDDCETPTSALPKQPFSSENRMSTSDPALTATLRPTSWHGLQSPEHKPSPDINICLHRE